MLCENVKHTEIDGTVSVLKLVPKMQLNKRDTPGVGAIWGSPPLHTHIHNQMLMIHNNELIIQNVFKNLHFPLCGYHAKRPLLPVKCPRFVGAPYPLFERRLPLCY